MLTDQHPTMKYSPEKYSRIKAVKDFGTIKAGTLGGYIEKESNLSQTGNAWVGCDSSGCAVVMGNAKVYGNALVTGGGRTESLGSPDGYGGATLVAGSAEIYGNAKILKGSEIFGGKVYGNATFHGTEVYSGAPTKPANPTEEAAAMSIAGEVFGDAHIYAGGRLGGSGSAGPNNNPKVYGNAILAGGDGTKTACWARVTYLGQVYENAKFSDAAKSAAAKSTVPQSSATTCSASAAMPMFTATLLLKDTAMSREMPKCTEMPNVRRRQVHLAYRMCAVMPFYPEQRRSPPKRDLKMPFAKTAIQKEMSPGRKAIVLLKTVRNKTNYFAKTPRFSTGCFSAFFNRPVKNN